MFDLRWTGVVIHDFDYFQRSLAKVGRIYNRFGTFADGTMHLKAPSATNMGLVSQPTTIPTTSDEEERGMAHPV